MKRTNKAEPTSADQMIERCLVGIPAELKAVEADEASIDAAPVPADEQERHAAQLRELGERLRREIAERFARADFSIAAVADLLTVERRFPLTSASGASGIVAMKTVDETALIALLMTAFPQLVESAKVGASGVLPLAERVTRKAAIAEKRRSLERERFELLERIAASGAAETIERAEQAAYDNVEGSLRRFRDAKDDYRDYISRLGVSRSAPAPGVEPFVLPDGRRLYLLPGEREQLTTLREKVAATQSAHEEASANHAPLAVRAKQLRDALDGLRRTTPSIAKNGGAGSHAIPVTGAVRAVGQLLPGAPDLRQ
jgi:hypothetical protein